MQEFEKVATSVACGRTDIAAGRCRSHEEVMPHIRSYLQYQAELLAVIGGDRTDVAAGRVHSSAEIMASVMAAIARAKARKAAK